jgi:hypothetical protein
MTKKKQGATPKSKSKNVPRKNQTPPKAGNNVVIRSAPAAIGSRSTTQKPQFYMRGDKICVRHCEYVQDIISDSFNEFAYDVFELSPTNATTHPWLASIAENFEVSKYLGVTSEFRSACPTDQAGKLIMAVDYDPDDPSAAVTKPEMLQWEGTVSSNYWENSRMQCSTRGLNTIGPRKFNQDANGADDRLAVSGLLYVATTSTNTLADPSSGGFLSVNFGELWIHYDVELGIPCLPNPALATATLPQMDQKMTVSAAVSSTTNLLAGCDAASTPTILEILERYGVRIIVPSTASQYLQAHTTGTFATTTTPLLLFEKDFNGIMTFLMKGTNFSTFVPTTFSVLQYGEATTSNGSSAAKPADINFGDNTILSLDEQSMGPGGGVGTLSITAFLKIAAKTALRLAAGSYATTAAGLIKTLVLGNQSAYRPKGDLTAFRECLDNRYPTPSAPVVSGTIVSS